MTPTDSLAETRVGAQMCCAFASSGFARCHTSRRSGEKIWKEVVVGEYVVRKSRKNLDMEL